MWNDDDNFSPSDNCEAQAEYKPAPAIDLRRLKQGTCVLCNTIKDVFEIMLIDPILLVVEITGTDPRFKKPVRGQYLGSFVGFDRCNTRIGCITREGKMCLGFRDGQLETSPIMSARVYGDNWSYPVF